MHTVPKVEPKPELRTIDYYMVGISTLPGFEHPIKLSSNESALGMSQAAIEAAQGALIDAHRYPETNTQALAQVIGSRFGLKPERIVFGPGSDELLQRIVNAFSGPGQTLIYSKNAYMQFPIYAKLAGATPIAAEDDDFRYSVEELLANVTEHTRIVLVANPDNPSGTYLGGKELRRLHQGLPKHVLLVIDAAYEEFATADDYESGATLADEAENVLVTRTFSKIYGMAGLRLGWCYGPPWIADLLTKIGPSFPVNNVAYAAGIASVNDEAHTARVLEHNRTWIDQLSMSFSELGLKVYPSQTNFILVAFPNGFHRTANEAAKHLNANGIIPRQFAVESYRDKLRFTVGLDWEMEKTIEIMEAYLGTL